MGVTGNGRAKPPKPKPGAKTSDEYGLRSRTSVGKSPVSAQKRTQEFLTPSKSPSDKATSSSSSFVCSVCQGAETLRNINLDKGIKNFCDEI